AIGPLTAMSWKDSGPSSGATASDQGTRPLVGLIEEMPQQWAGLRSEPPMSLPAPSGDMPEARAEPSPPDEPPAVRSACQGLRVSPRRLLSVDTRSAMS